MREQIERVRVTNHNPFLLEDRFDGVPYEFPPGETVIVPPEVAAHIFGFPAEQPELYIHMARRFGWNRPEHYQTDEKGLMLWQRMAANIKIAVEHYEVRRVHAPGAPIPAQEAGDAPDMMTGLNIDPPAPRRASVGRKRAARKRQLTPRVPTANVEPNPPSDSDL